MKINKIEMFIDGAARGNPGPAGLGVEWSGVARRGQAGLGMARHGVATFWRTK